MSALRMVEVDTDVLMEPIGKAVSRWMPSFAEMLPGWVGETQAGVTARRYLAYTTKGEPLQVGALIVARDPRPASDEVPLPCGDSRYTEGRGLLRRYGEDLDLAVWYWESTGRTASLPFRPLRDLTVAKWKEWSHNERIEKGVAAEGSEYWEWSRLMVPLLDVREAVRDHLSMRFHVQQYDGVSFCRMPSCPYGALYPSKPQKGVWCYNHWLESRGIERLHHTADTMTSAERKKQLEEGRRQPNLHLVGSEEEAQADVPAAAMEPFAGVGLWLDSVGL